MPKKHNKAAHEELLKQGSYTITPDRGGEDAIYVSYMDSRGVKGGGTALMRDIVGRALQSRKTVELEAAWASHGFHLYMGMIPKDHKVNYVSAQYGRPSELSLKTFKNCNEISQLPLHVMVNLFRVLRKEKCLTEDAALTQQDLIDNRNFLLELGEKRVSYLKFDFIPFILNTIEDCMHEKNIKIYGCLPMTLSESGKERWRDAIEHDLEFVPFRRFEHLRPFMDESEIVRLDSLLQMRDQIVQQNAASETDMAYR